MSMFTVVNNFKLRVSKTNILETNPIASNRSN